MSKLFIYHTTEQYFKMGEQISNLRLQRTIFQMRSKLVIYDNEQSFSMIKQVSN